MIPIIQIDDRMLEDVRQRLGEFSDKAPQAISRSLNRALTNIASNVSKEVRKEYNIKASDVKSSLNKKSSTRNKLSGYVISTGHTVPLEKFKVSPKKPDPRRKRPFKVAVRKGSPRAVEGGFMTNLDGLGLKFVSRSGIGNNPSKGTYARKKYKRRGGLYVREMISLLSGPSVPQMLGNEGIQERINASGVEMFQRRLDHEINRIIERGSVQ